ncbi:alpha/beta hydrolase [Thauera sp. CAU 1555]|uniref:Alpha/beta hydrolase n=1 Tax=Thauera sedimentorum TaxID=2767595 RepID=A0ABR9BB82_9RHOO|nr:alpha/beta hydrolase [Thauera sedimentorum]MBC9072701.1 alpha/beta hydrolase [Thauera sedimentorum]MBD8503620.1 alpha/beta hydrolase [Thauera sedimentorum]
MNTNRFGELEVLCRAPAGKQVRPTPLLFVHGAYTGAWCWDEHFLPWFAARGWTSYAVSLSGHGATRRRAPLDAFSIEDYVDDLVEVIGKLPETPVLIGHSMGGMVVQKYLERGDAPGVVLMSSVPPQGLMGSAVELMFKKPNLLVDLNRIMGGGTPQLDSLRDALFHQPVDEADLLRYYRLCQPESHRAIWDMTLFNLPRPTLMHRPPMLVLGAEHDHLIPPVQVMMTATTYGRQAEILPGLGHGMMLERDWERVAERIADWLEERHL